MAHGAWRMVHGAWQQRTGRSLLPLWSCLLAPVPLQSLDRLARTWVRMPMKPRRRVVPCAVRYCPCALARALLGNAVRCGAAICCRSTRTSSASHATGPKRCTCAPRRAAPLGFRHRYCVHPCGTRRVPHPAEGCSVHRPIVASPVDPPLQRRAAAAPLPPSALVHTGVQRPLFWHSRTERPASAAPATAAAAGDRRLAALLGSSGAGTTRSGWARRACARSTRARTTAASCRCLGPGCVRQTSACVEPKQSHAHGAALGPALHPACARALPCTPPRAAQHNPPLHSAGALDRPDPVGTD